MILRNKWVGVLIGLVAPTFGVWSTIDIVKTTLDGVLFVVNLLAGMLGLGFSAIGVVIG